jgi:hypothetical protein
MINVRSLRCVCKIVAAPLWLPRGQEFRGLTLFLGTIDTPRINEGPTQVGLCASWIMQIRIMRKWDYAKVGLCASRIMRNWNYALVELCISRIMRSWDYAQVGLCSSRIMRKWDYAEVELCANGIMYKSNYAQFGLCARRIMHESVLIIHMVN